MLSRPGRSLRRRVASLESHFDHHAKALISALREITSAVMYAYYGGVYIGRNVTIDTTGKPVGYGYTGSSNSQNRAINEFTFGFNQTLWASPRYGGINLMGQYEWLERSPWFVAAGAPKGTHDNTIYMNIRYTLPGGMPSF